jgi:alpha-N-acetylglucosaminidase
MNVGGREYQRFQFNGVNSSAAVLPTSAAILQLIDDLDTTLKTDRNFLLGNWLEDAKRWGPTPDERASHEFNARNQITMWGPDNNINDYAVSKQRPLISN